VATRVKILLTPALIAAATLLARWWLSAGAGVSAFLIATLILERASPALAIAFTLVCVLLILTAGIIPVRTTVFGPARPPGWDLPMRMLVATAIVVGLTTIAAKVGPRWTGLLSPFPVFALVLGAFTHRTQRAGSAAYLLRGVVLGSLGHATMFAVVASWLIPYGLLWTYSWASLCAVAVNGLALSVVTRTGPWRRPADV
jgi:hypothetical protein